MDLIGVCVMAVVLHVIVNRCFGYRPGWRRMLHWPVIAACALLCHLVLVVPPGAWLMEAVAVASRRYALILDMTVSGSGALTGAFLLRRRWREARRHA